MSVFSLKGLVHPKIIKNYVIYYSQKNKIMTFQQYLVMAVFKTLVLKLYKSQWFRSRIKLPNLRSEPLKASKQCFEIGITRYC